MTPEQLAERFPDRFRYFDLCVEYGRRRGNVTDGLQAYNSRSCAVGGRASLVTCPKIW